MPKYTVWVINYYTDWGNYRLKPPALQGLERRGEVEHLQDALYHIPYAFGACMTDPEFDEKAGVYFVDGVFEGPAEDEDEWFAMSIITEAKDDRSSDCLLGLALHHMKEISA